MVNIDLVLLFFIAVLRRNIKTEDRVAILVMSGNAIIFKTWLSAPTKNYFLFLFQ